MSEKSNHFPTPIHDFLTEYAQSDTIRLHMPGGKGADFPLDITEINGADVLYECSGIIRESERNTAKLYGAAETCYSCGGSTLAIQAMLYAACQRSGKRKIAAGRYSHKSLINTAILLGLDVNWIYPEEFLGCGLSPEAIGKAIDSDTAAVFVNSVDYLGGECDIEAAARVCRNRGVPLLTDNAHGAYKVFTGGHPIALGADMCADSAHKTLPALTGAAYLHLADSSYLAGAKAGMAMFGSSSPSYLILDSLDLCARYIAEQRDDALRTAERVQKLKARLTADGITLRQSDDMRITLDALSLGYTGYEAGQFLRLHGAEPEMCDERYTVMLFSTVQPERDFAVVYDILRKIPRKAPLTCENEPLLMPEKVLTPREAFFSPKITVPSEPAYSEGRICAGVFSPCPPCVPIVMPGERISADAARALVRYGVTDIDVVNE